MHAGEYRTEGPGLDAETRQRYRALMRADIRSTAIATVITFALGLAFWRMAILWLCVSGILCLGIVEKPPRDEAPTNWINAGTYVLEPSVLQRIDTGRKVSIERETFPSIVADGGLWAVQSDAYWVDAGTPATYIQIQQDLVDGRRGGSWDAVASNATVADDAIVEHSVVMAGATVGAGAVIRESVVSIGATVEAGAVIDGSIVGPRATVGAGAKLTGMAMLGDDAVADAGALLDGVKVPESA